MPRGRSRGAATRASNPQQRLSFGPNATNKITKPSPLGSGDAKKSSKLSPKQKAQLEQATVTDITPPKSPSPAEDAKKSSVEPDTKGLPLRRNERASATVEYKDAEQRDVKELEAEKVSQAQIKKYWTQKEQARRAPRVHQEGLGLHEKILREWDLSNQYGPCVGITRMKRWKRAERMGLKPPLEVLAVLLKEESQQKGRAKDEVQKAYIDTLIGGKSVEVEA